MYVTVFWFGNERVFTLWVIQKVIIWKVWYQAFHRRAILNTLMYDYTRNNVDGLQGMKEICQQHCFCCGLFVMSFLLCPCGNFRLSPHSGYSLWQYIITTGTSKFQLAHVVVGASNFYPAYEISTWWCNLWSMHTPPDQDMQIQTDTCTSKSAHKITGQSM